MSDDGKLNVKCKILEIFCELDDTDLDMIENWISSKSYKEIKDLEIKKASLKSEKMLKKISDSIKKLVPFEAEMPTEIIAPPIVGDQADCTEYNTCHVDEFLYDEDELEILVEEGKLKRYYCLDCKSRNVEKLTYISHSMSRQVLQYIFTVLLPKDVEEMQLLDVGSRLGSVLYAAYYYTNISKIIGIEINKECCEVQEKIINQYSMDDRIKIINADVMERNDIVECSKIFIINVFDFFVNVEKHKELWYFFKNHISNGSYLVLNRCITETLGSLDMFEEFMDWLTICKPCQLENEVYFDLEDYSELFLYKINKK